VARLHSPLRLALSRSSTVDFSGAVLTGGASRRMGTDKAFVPVGPDAQPMVAVPASALVEAGAREVLAIGGDLDRLTALGLDARPDDHPGEGPLGGVLTALRLAAHDRVVVLACDLPAVDATTVGRVLDALAAAPAAPAAVAPVAAVAVDPSDGRRHPLLAAYRRAAAEPLAAAFAAGERGLLRALAAVAVVEVELPDPAAARNANRPEDLRPDPVPDAATNRSGRGPR